VPVVRPVDDVCVSALLVVVAPVLGVVVVVVVVVVGDLLCRRAVRRSVVVCGRAIGPPDQRFNVKAMTDCLTSHYRSYRGRIFTGQMTQPTVSEH